MLILNPMIFQKLFITCFWLQFGEFFTLGKSLKSWCEGIETDIESNDAVFKSKEVEDREDCVGAKLGIEDQQTDDGDAGQEVGGATTA